MDINREYKTKCKITSSIGGAGCGYQVSGITDMYLLNYDADNRLEFYDSSKGDPEWDDVMNEIAHDAENAVSKIELANPDNKAFRFHVGDGSTSFSDELVVGGNNRKYRSHKVSTHFPSSVDISNQMDAISLGRFSVILIDKNKDIWLLGFNNGMKAVTANYESGAGDDDESGWSIELEGVENTTMLRVLHKKVFEDIIEDSHDVNEVP